MHLAVPTLYERLFSAARDVSGRAIYWCSAPHPGGPSFGGGGIPRPNPYSAHPSATSSFGQTESDSRSTHSPGTGTVIGLGAFSG